MLGFLQIAPGRQTKRVIKDDRVLMGFELDYTTWQLVLAGLILLGSSLLQGVIGFGAGVFGIPLLWMAGFDIETAIPIIVMTSMIQSLIGSVRLREHAQWRIACRPAAIRILVIPLGLWMRDLISQGPMGDIHIRQAIGVVLLLIVIVKYFVRVEPEEELSFFWTWVAFPISGFLLGFCGMGGPAVAIWVMAQPWNPLRSRAFLFNMLVTGMVSLAILSILWFPEKTPLGLAIGAAGAPFVFLGTFLGMRVGDRLPRKKLQAWSLVVLLLIALKAVFFPVSSRDEELPGESVQAGDRQVMFDATVTTGQWDGTSVISCQPGTNQTGCIPLFFPVMTHNCTGIGAPERCRLFDLVPRYGSHEEGSCRGLTALGGYGLDGISVL